MPCGDRVVGQSRRRHRLGLRADRYWGHHPDSDRLAKTVAAMMLGICIAFMVAIVLAGAGE